MCRVRRKLQSLSILMKIHGERLPGPTREDSLARDQCIDSSEAAGYGLQIGYDTDSTSAKGADDQRLLSTNHLVKATLVRPKQGESCSCRLLIFTRNPLDVGFPRNKHPGCLASSFHICCGASFETPWTSVSRGHDSSASRRSVRLLSKIQLEAVLCPVASPARLKLPHMISGTQSLTTTGALTGIEDHKVS